MNIFKQYSKIYDLLYYDKDYEKEAKFINNLLQEYSPGARILLEFGCGTASHAFHLAEMNYMIHGIDISTEMLKEAKKVLKKHPQKASLIKLTKGDIRKIKLNNKFDAVISLFHVMSYQTRNNDLISAFATAKAHLKKDGIFIFDFWYGPAVLSNMPSIKIKNVQNKNFKITRIAEPFLIQKENMVKVIYHIYIQDINSGQIQFFQESHLVRFLFQPEIDLLLELTGFKKVEFCEWMSRCEPGLSTWNVYCIGRA